MVRPACGRPPFADERHDPERAARARPPSRFRALDATVRRRSPTPPRLRPAHPSSLRCPPAPRPRRRRDAVPHSSGVLACRTSASKAITSGKPSQPGSTAMPNLSANTSSPRANASAQACVTGSTRTITRDCHAVSGGAPVSGQGRASWRSRQTQLAAEEVRRTGEPDPELLDMEHLRPPSTTRRGIVLTDTALAARDAPIGPAAGLTADAISSGRYASVTGITWRADWCASVSVGPARDATPTMSFPRAGRHTYEAPVRQAFGHRLLHPARAPRIWTRAPEGPVPDRHRE